MTSRILLRGGCVLTLGARTPNFTEADVLIDGDRIAEVGPGVRARDAERVDADGTIVMPGFVDTHRHAWRSLLRNLGSNGGEPASPAASTRPEDLYAGTLISLLGAVEAGITTVVDWLDVPPDPEFVDAALQAHREAGLRTVLVQAAGSSRPDDGGTSRTREVLARLIEAAAPSTTIALGIDALGSEGTSGTDVWALARGLGLPIQVHGGSGTIAPAAISQAARRGLLGVDVTLVHGSGLDEPTLDAVAASNASVSLAPSSEMASGRGSPPIQQLIDRNIRPGLGVDDERVSPGDLFAQMRATISFQHATVFDRKLAGKAGLPRLLSTRDVIRFATLEGARVAGLGRVTGSLEPGKQADLIVLRTDRPNVFPINDPIGAVVWGMDTSNVDWVMVGGRVLMREGILQTDVERARTLARTAQHRVATDAGLAVGTALGGEG
ncbi:MAG: amidohydrolase family protein [Actinobacteria bacterium]|nr:amidohydrolase family protein [Actinomycetota bacterium]